MSAFTHTNSTENHSGGSGLKMRRARHLSEADTYKRLQRIARALVHPRSASIPSATFPHSYQPCINWLD